MSKVKKLCADHEFCNLVYTGRYWYILKHTGGTYRHTSIPGYIIPEYTRIYWYILGYTRIHRHIPVYTMAVLHHAVTTVTISLPKRTYIKIVNLVISNSIVHHGISFDITYHSGGQLSKETLDVCPTF